MDMLRIAPIVIASHDSYRDVAISFAVTMTVEKII